MVICWGEFSVHGQRLHIHNRFLVFHSQIDDKIGWFVATMHTQSNRS